VIVLRRFRIRGFHLFLSCLLMFLLVVLYSRFIEPTWLAVTHVTVQLPHLPRAFDGMTVVQLSDIHYPDYLSRDYYRRVVEKANALHPDLIVLTGDYVPHEMNAIATCGQLLGGLHAPFGVYAVLGNHDYWLKPAMITKALRDNGIKVLINQSVPLRRSNACCWLVGVDDEWSGAPDLRKALHGVPENDEKILLVHEPDFADYARTFPFDLQLSGHSHGGQVRFPFIGGVHYPPFAERYPSGYYHVGSLQLYTNRGVGVILPFRLDCRPEITRLTLHSAQ